MPFFKNGDNKPKVTFVHMNQWNIHGVKDSAAGAAGEVLNVVNKAAPALVAASVACEAYQIGKSVVTDIENHSSRNTIKKTATTVATTAGGFGACSLGATIGTAILPGIGTLFGGFIGGVLGGTTAGIASEVASEVILETVNYDIDDKICKKCGKEFKLRRYQEGSTQELCHECR